MEPDIVVGLRYGADGTLEYAVMRPAEEGEPTRQVWWLPVPRVPSTEGEVENHEGR